VVSACQTVQHGATLLCAGNLLEGVKRRIGNLVFVTLPPKRPLRAACQRVRGIIRKRLAPFVPDTHGHTCGAPPSLTAFPHPLPRCAPSPHSALRPSSLAPPALPIRCTHHTCSLASLPHRLRPQRVPLCSRKTISTLSSNTFISTMGLTFFELRLSFIYALLRTLTLSSCRSLSRTLALCSNRLTPSRRNDCILCSVTTYVDDSHGSATRRTR